MDNNTQIMKFDKLINRYIKNQNFVKIKRKFNKVSVDLTGYLLNQNSNFLLIHKEEELYLNGYSIIRKDQLNSIRYNKYDKVIENIMLKEGFLDKSINLNFKIDLSSWESIFLNLKQADKHVNIECEKKKTPEFYIGIIEQVNKKSIYLRYFDPTGLLDKELTKIKFKKITIVKFGDRYTEIFKKYLKRDENEA